MIILYLIGKLYGAMFKIIVWIVIFPVWFMIKLFALPLEGILSSFKKIGHRF